MGIGHLGGCTPIRAIVTYADGPGFPRANGASPAQAEAFSAGVEVFIGHPIGDADLAVREVANQPEFASQPPHRIVARLADQGIWLASESTFYRVLKEAEQ